MILIDTSAWVEFLRDTGSPVCQRVDDLLAGEIATCDVSRMEVLAVVPAMSNISGNCAGCSRERRSFRWNRSTMMQQRRSTEPAANGDTPCASLLTA